MQNITARKHIRSSGDSLTINATKELRQLGLGKDDEVVVTFGPSGPDDEHINHLAMLVANPHNYYRNSRWLQAGDLDENGTAIPDKSDYLNQLDIRETMDRLSAWRSMIEGGFIMTRALLPRDCAYYSDKVGSFILNFDPDKVESQFLDCHHRAKYLMEFFHRMVNDPILSDYDLHSLDNLRAAIKSVISDMNQMEDERFSGPLTPDNAQEKMNAINDEWDERMRELNAPVAWFFTVTVKRNPDGTYDQNPVFRVYRDSAFIANAKRNATAELEELNGNDDGCVYDITLFGPFQEESEAIELNGYFKTVIKLKAVTVDENNVKKLHRIADCICVTGYLDTIDDKLRDFNGADLR